MAPLSQQPHLVQGWRARRRGGRVHPPALPRVHVVRATAEAAHQVLQERPKLRRANPAVARLVGGGVRLLQRRRAPDRAREQLCDGLQRAQQAK